MKIRRSNWWFTWSAIVALVVSVAGVLELASQPSFAQSKGFSQYVDKQGNISLPKDFRTSWSFLGAWFVPDPEAQVFTTCSHKRSRSRLIYELGSSLTERSW